MNKLSKKELVLRFVERNGIVRRKDIIKFIVDLNYGKGTYDQNPEKWRGYYGTHLCTGDSYGKSTWFGTPKGYLLEGEDRLLRIERGIFVALRNGILSNKSIYELPIAYHGNDVYQLLDFEIPDAIFDFEPKQLVLEFPEDEPKQLVLEFPEDEPKQLVLEFPEDEPQKTIDVPNYNTETILVFTVNEKTGEILQDLYPVTSTAWKTNVYSTTDADMAKSISDHIKYMVGEKESEIQEVEKIERMESDLKEAAEDYNDKVFEQFLESAELETVYEPSEQVKDYNTVPKENRKPATPIIELPCKPGDEVIAIIEYEKNEHYYLKKITVSEINICVSPEGTTIEITDEDYDTYDDVQIAHSFKEATEILKTLTLTQS